MRNNDRRQPEMESATASSLIRRVQANDREAWFQLTALYGPLVYHWCRRLGVSGEDAADTFQEVFAAVARSVGRFDLEDDHQGTFRGWLWTITKNKVRDHWRRQQGDALAAGGTAAQLRLAEVADPFEDEALTNADRGEAGSVFHRALKLIEAEFETRTWQAFMRAAVQQEPTDQIASDLQMSTASVRQAKSRVLRRLRQVLGDLPAP